MGDEVELLAEVVEVQDEVGEGASLREQLGKTITL